ncbi:hypothetical protein GCM10011608_44730 [Micromonospora sonchi]|uniref:Thioesterase domain-containing protein n=1 Tax=Micromonospora sonchi TaxID=1763543 RepID=A0A917U355_9ACTN|nr:hypothetical protein [Micromonospora sonchi]GGM54875.1 hypothetical protein GCM10011608_44730 [Micromonospora sonchi]
MSDSYVETPAVEVTDELIRTIVSSGGYTHPLFNPTPWQRAEGVDAPLPGQGVLLLAGGLVEQSGILDRAIALLELRSVVFHSMVRAGAWLRVRLTPGPVRHTRSGKAIQEFAWQVVDGAGAAVAEATAVMLMADPVKER